MVDFAQRQSELRALLWTFVICAVAFVSIFTAGTMWLLIFEGKPPVTYNGMALYNRAGELSNTFRAGDTMLLTRSFCSKRAAVDIDRRLVSMDGKSSFFVDSSTSVFPDGCRSDTRIILLPEVIPPGRYRYVVQISYPTNNPFNAGVIMAPAPTIDIVP